MHLGACSKADDDRQPRPGRSERKILLDVLNEGEANRTMATATSTEASSAKPPGAPPQAMPAPKRRPSPMSKRLVSLDAYRGLIMTMLAASGFGIARLAQLPADAPVWDTLDYSLWQRIGFHFEHPPWVSNFGVWGVSFWDLIQPAFMFMVGVAMPYSYARRASLGHSRLRRFAHAAWRGTVLVLIGVFLRSLNYSTTHWVFIDVVAQIGLGYLFLYAMMEGGKWVQWIGFAVILVGYYLLFLAYTPPADYDYGAVFASKAKGEVFEGRFVHWSKNANIAYRFDQWFLHLFPRPPEEKFISHHKGGYVTLNFVPSIATMLLGLFCGQLLRAPGNRFLKFLYLAFAGAALIGLGVAAGEYVCPIVKRLWTPSWVLFSGGWVILGLALMYFLFDVLPLRWIAFPLAVVGMNSIAMYLMGWLIRGFTIKNIHIHFQGLLESTLGSEALADNMFGRVIDPTAAFVVFWLIALWMYRQRFFVRV